jgi:carboxylesterase type B
LYQFNHSLSFDGWGPDLQCCVSHVCHAAELPYVFHSLRDDTPFHFTPEEKILSDDMVEYWTNFAWSGDPNTNNRGLFSKTKWPVYNSADKRNMQFVAPNSYVRENLLSQACDFWDSIGYNIGT